MLSSLVGETDSSVNESEHFIKWIHNINLQIEDCLVSFDVVTLFTKVPVEEILQVIRNIFNTDPSFPERSPLQDEDVISA
jgi:hypothetical protein